MKTKKTRSAVVISFQVVARLDLCSKVHSQRIPYSIFSYKNQQGGSQGTGLAQSCGRKTQGQRGVRGSGGSSAMCNPQAEWKNPFSRVVGGFSLGNLHLT